MRKIEKVITGAAVVLFFVSMSALDSKSWLPLILCVASCVILGIMANRNGWIYDPEMEEEDV